MRLVNASVPDAVREIITQNRSIYDCMKMDLINYTALAVKIQSVVEKHLGGQVNLNTIVVAIKRYSDSFEQKDEVKKESVLKNARLSLTDGILGIKFSTDNFGIAEDKFSTGLAKIKILIPPEQDRNDVASYVAGVLHSNGIEPANAFFSQDNITIVLNEKDASRAYEILRSEIVR